MDGQENSGYDRSFANRKYYEQNKLKSHKSSLLHNIKRKGRVPFLKSVKLYDITIMEIVERYRVYRQSVGGVVSPLKDMKMKVLIQNMI